MQEQMAFYKNFRGYSSAPSLQAKGLMLGSKARNLHNICTIVYTFSKTVIEVLHVVCLV